MNFAFSEEQEELRRYVRQWMNQRMPLSRVRELMANPAGYERSDWSAVAEMGWQAMAIPEAYGGAGFGLLELAVLAEEQGRGLFCGPFLSTVVASATALLEAGSEQHKSELLPQIAAGELVVAIAVTEEATGHDGEHMTTSARRSGDDWVIDGTKRFVIDGHSADLLIVAAQTVDGTGLFLVPADADGVTRRRLDTLDETRPQAEIAFDEVVVTDDARLPGSASQAMHRINAVVATMLAVEAVGGAQATLDMAVEYAKDRQQFGKPIGSFQAVKHMCADMLIDVESARAAAYYAAWCVAMENDEADLVVPLAKAHCTDAFFRCAATNIQVHGGIGFTWEHDAHLYLKRAKSSQTMFGSPEDHRRELAERLGF